MYYENKIYKAICTPEWLAKAYSDYLADIAAEQFQLISDITDIVSSNTLEDGLYADVQSIEDEINRVKNLVADYFAGQHIGEANYDPWESEGTTSWRIACSSIASEAGLHDYILNIVSKYGLTPTQVPPGGDILNLKLEDWFWNRDGVKSVLYAPIDNYLNSKGLPLNFSYTLNEGMTKFRDMTFEMMKSYSQVDTYDFALQCSDGQSDSLHTLTFTYDNIIDQIKTNAVSALAWAQGFLACDKNSVADGIEQFRANMDQVVSDATGKFSSIIASVKSTIANTAGNVSRFLQTATEFMGIDKIGGSFTTVDETDIYDYTGASPLAGINFKSAQGLASAVGKLALAAGAAAWEGLKWIGSKLWNWAKPVLKNFTDDPTDLVVEDKNSQSYRIQNWHWQNSTTGSVPIVFSINDNASLNEKARWQRVVNKINQSAANTGDVPISFDTVFGSINVRVTADYHDVGNHATITLNVLAEFFPKAVDYNAAFKLGLIRTPIYNYKGRNYDSLELGALNGPGADGLSVYDRYVTLLNQFVDSGQLRPSDENDEQYMYKCFGTSITILNWCLHYIAVHYSRNFIHQSATLTTALISREDGTGLSARTISFTSLHDAEQSYSHNITWTLWPTNAKKVTNLDFLKVASGYNPGADEDEDFAWAKFDGLHVKTNIGTKMPVEAGTNNMVLGANRFAALILLPYLYSLYERTYDPTNFSFIPYVRGTSDFSDSRYRIKTDSENQNLVNVFLNIALVVIVVATIIIVGSKILKTRKLKKLSKMGNYMGQQDNAIWSHNKRLSPREQRKYLRYSKKYEKLSASFVGLAGGDDSSSSILDKVQRINSTVSSLSGVDVTKSLMHGEIVQAVDDNASDLATIKRRIG